MTLAPGKNKAASLWFWSMVLLSGCMSMQPVDLPPEYAAAPAETSLWETVGASAPADWHVLLNDGPVALDWRLRAIDSASASIELQTFLWQFDTTGSLILDHLLTAADRGVAVRILIDDTFLVGEDDILLALAEHPNISYRVFNPFKRRSGGLATRQLLNLGEFRRLDHRMHNKSMIVDNRVAIVGGRNLADEYFGLHNDANFRDLELLFGGPSVAVISAAFDNYWNDRWSIPIEMIAHTRPSAEQLRKAATVADESIHIHNEESPGTRAARWLDLIAQGDTGKAILFFDKPPAGNPKNRDEAPVQVANELVALFDAAVEEILIVSAYLIPTPELEGAVERAIRRGVRVRILTNSLRSNNHVTAHSAYRKHIETLLDHGAEIHEVRIDADDRKLYMLTPIGRKMLALHAKALVIDRDKVFIGSANLDPRSLRINTEMGFLVISPSFNARVRAAVEGDFSEANAWRLEAQDNGRIYWISSDETLTEQPAMSFMQRLEDWFFSYLPIENKL